MTIKVEQVTGWNRVCNAARFTVRKEAITGEPSVDFKRKMLKAEHSPIRLLEFDVKMYGIPYFVAMHFVRHHVGVTPFVSTSRPDRTGDERTDHEIPRDEPVNLWMNVNAQALIAMSRQRLCTKAHPKTRQIWEEVCSQVIAIDPAFTGVLAPNCVYRYGCPEPSPCGLFKTLIQGQMNK